MNCHDCKKDKTCGSRKGSHHNCFEPKEPTRFEIAELETVWKSGGLLKPDAEKERKP